MHLLHGTLRQYHWGSLTELPELLGVPPTGQPVSEYWLGAYPTSSSTLADGRRLADVAPLDFMIKAMAVERPTSIQLHPSDEQARAGFAREQAARVPHDAAERIYRDSSAKAELTVALSPTEALVGFRDPQESHELLEAFGLTTRLSTLLAPLYTRGGEAGLAELFLHLLSTDDPEPALEVEDAAKRHAEDQSPVGDLARVALRLCAQTPGNAGVIAALLMNLVHLQPGDGMVVSPNTLHCLVQGTMLEITGASDNVVRGGLTTKHIDVDEVVNLASFRPGPPQVIRPQHVGAGIWRFGKLPAWRLEPSAGQGVRVPASEKRRLMLVLSDTFDQFTRGQGVFLDAGEQVRLQGPGLAYVTAGRPVIDA